MFVNRYPGRRAARRAARGAALIEAIVALVVLGLGLLGLVGAQTRLLADGRANAQRATAIWLTDDLANRLTTNRDAALTGQYNRAWDDGAPPMPNPNCAAAPPCTPAQQAAIDLIEWLGIVQGALPGATTTVFRSASDARQLGIAISWVPNESVASADDQKAVRTLLNATVAANGATCPDNNRLCHLSYVAP
jgi:type IV pilus assembly protein PilV